MTYKTVIALQLFLYFCVTTSNSQYYPRQYRSSIYGRRHWNYSGQNSTFNLNRVKITVYYETLCPASVDYLTKTLRPAVEKLGPHLNVHLVPYGHAETRLMNKRYKFSCQHGPAECYGNRLHACAIDVIRNNTMSALFNACLMDTTKYIEGVGHDYTVALTTCSYKLNVPSEDIWQCVNTRRGVILQKQYGDETRRLPHRLEYVPYVLINGKEEALNEDLTTALCRKINPPPSVCPARRNYPPTYSRIR